MDAEYFIFEDISWQTKPPPARHPVPARYVPNLEVGDELTIGVPGRYYIDGQILVRTDHEDVPLPGEETPRESLALCAPLYYWTWQADPKQTPIMQWWPVEHAWVYQDAVAPGSEGVAQDRDDDGARSWLDRVRADANEPPVLSPVPAREAGSLTGRTLRARNASGQWFWFVGVSEPISVDGDICVQAVPPSHWWLHQLSYYEELQEKVRTIALHRLFAYA
ncbi:MAG: hypothetical protein FWF90_13285 [Promicromonosporaceae bacterium]|nr:hypothetical protein [Promicromonosporaceae bacterium]